MKTSIHIQNETQKSLNYKLIFIMPSYHYNRDMTKLD